MPDAPRTDATMDGRTGISPDLPPGTQMSQREIDALVDREATRRVEAANAEHATALSQASDKAGRDAAVSTLQAMIDGNPGDTLEAAQFRGKIQDMVLAIHGGSDKPPAEYAAEAMRLNEARIQALAATTPGTEGEQLAEVHADNAGGYQTFCGAYMGALFSEAKRLGEALDGEKLTGAPELEYASTLLDKPGMREQFHQLQGEAGPRSRVVPFPLAMVRPDAAFAETRATAVTSGQQRREPTFRRDALVPYFRPNNVLAGLGVPMPVINNDITLPRLSDSIQANWATETAAATDDALVTTALTTAPHRLVSRDSVTFMLLAAADAQFGHEPLIISEMVAAHMQRKERAVYDGASTGDDPTGIKNTSNVNAPTSLASAITYGDVLDIVTVLANLSLPVEMAKFAINPNSRRTLSMVQKFASGGATVLNDTGFREPGAGIADAGQFGATPTGEMAGIPTYVTTHIPTASNDHTDIFLGLWQYVWCIDYGTAFLTIDDISDAGMGRTLVTMNTYHDVAVRFPQAFVVQNYDRSP